MQEEVTQKTIALVFKSSRLIDDVLKKTMKMYLEHRKAETGNSRKDVLRIPYVNIWELKLQIILNS